MKMRAYPEIYLNHAQAALGDAFDYAVNDCHLDGGTFVNYFTASPICRRIENGEPLYLTGKSGIEIARDVIFSITRNEADIKIGFSEHRTDGVSNAMLANVLEYGKHGQAAKPFLKPAVKSAKSACEQTMISTFESEVDKI